MKNHIIINRRNHFLIICLSSLLFLAGSELKAQQSNKVLFLGNSYTGTNNLPQIISDVAQSVGDTLIFDSNTPGGANYVNHFYSTVSQNKIMAGDWDYVVLQGQSQEPLTDPHAFHDGFDSLYNQIRQYNPCTTIMPFMTWGRKNGNASLCPFIPSTCTYLDMDNELKDNYLGITNFANGEVSPVSVVWRYIRENHPTIELYHADESHPSAAGSYAAACCFYSAIFKKDPTLITYDFSLNATDAAVIRNAAKMMVYDSLNLWDYKELPIADFKYSIGAGVNEVIFRDISPYHSIQQNNFWEFGDGTTSTLRNPTHSYLSDGTYTVQLTTTNCDLQGTNTSIKDTVIQFCSHTPTIFKSNPWLCKNDTLWTEPADSYQWLAGPLDTNQHLHRNGFGNNNNNFSVISTVNGCSELSRFYSITVEESGYHFESNYFMASYTHCQEDTVKWAVTHVDGFLSGLEIIKWYKNDTLLSNTINDDTLLIYENGTYSGYVVNPSGNCPFDTTRNYQDIYFDCEVGVGIENINDYNQNLYWSMFPNPASETITIIFMNDITLERVQIYDIVGHLVKEINVSVSTKLNISDLPNGVYFIRLKNNKQPALKFVKQ